MAEAKKEAKKKASSKAKKDNPQNKTKTSKAPERDSRGRFKKGECGNPGGRPKIPDELKEYAVDSFKRLKEIANDPDTPVRVKADIEKWFVEMTYGKSRQQVDIDADVQNTGKVTVEFEGELDEWSR